ERINRNISGNNPLSKEVCDIDPKTKNKSNCRQEKTCRRYYVISENGNVCTHYVCNEDNPLLPNYIREYVKKNQVVYNFDNNIYQPHSEIKNENNWLDFLSIRVNAQGNTNKVDAKEVLCEQPFRIRERWTPRNGLKFSAKTLCKDTTEPKLTDKQIEILTKYDTCLNWSINGFPNFKDFVKNIKDRNLLNNPDSAIPYKYPNGAVVVTRDPKEWRGDSNIYSSKGDFGSSCVAIDISFGEKCKFFLNENKYTWHHIEFSSSLLLIPKDLHSTFGHHGACSTGCYPKN
ncbi:MAG: HNH endonuclease, partial [Patescibacteria group bacterium]